jgi:DNA-binding PadR family transcriptional regulator
MRKPWQSKEVLVLHLLRDGGEMYGLQLVDRSAGALKRGTVYVTLGRLEEKGLVARRLPADAPPTPGLPRPLYRCTAPGLRHLAYVELLAVELGKPLLQEGSP